MINDSERTASEPGACRRVRRRPRFTIKHHLLRYAHPSALRRTSMYVSVLGISQALHLVLAGESGKPLTDGPDWMNTNLTVDLGRQNQLTEKNYVIY